MALTTCPECAGKVSTKAILCPHCGYPMQNKPIPQPAPKRGRKRRANGSGTIVKLSGNRRNPYQVRVNTHLDDRGYPTFDVLGTFPDQVHADIALAKYNENPYDVDLRGSTFSEVYEKWYLRRFKRLPSEKVKGGRSSSEYVSMAAYKKCAPLQNKVYAKIRTQEMQDIADDALLSHSMAEHVVMFLKHLGRYALEFDVTEKDYAAFLKVNKPEDDEHGIAFSKKDLKKLWKNLELPFVDSILIYCYSGWRINELSKMPLKDIDLTEKTFFGGLKSNAGKNRIVPIHSAILPLVHKRYDVQFKSLIYHDDTGDISESKYREYFNAALVSCSITQKYTPHDCRHTFNSLLDEAGASRSCKLKLMGHAGDVNDNIYTHKELDELRAAVECIKLPN